MTRFTYLVRSSNQRYLTYSDVEHTEINGEPCYWFVSDRQLLPLDTWGTPIEQQPVRMTRTTGEMYTGHWIGLPELDTPSGVGPQQQQTTTTQH
jgi:hypothetical protein